MSHHPGTPAQVPPAKIAIVDDSKPSRMVLAKILRKAGHTVSEAETGSEAIALVKTLQPDLAILDIRMPGMNGFEVCRQLKADAVTASIPVLFVSALEQVQDTVHAFEVGGCDYIHKPFQPAEVLARVHAHLTLRRQQQQIHSWNTQLEERVRERTVELERTNRDLAQEILHRQQVQKELEHIALYDPLTRLPNRHLLLHETSRRLDLARHNPEHRFALLLMDCDRFKTINDSLGHRSGDRLLQSIGNRLQARKSLDTFVARLGEDEFGVLVDLASLLDGVDVPEEESGDRSSQNGYGERGYSNRFRPSKGTLDQLAGDECDSAGVESDLGEIALNRGDRELSRAGQTLVDWVRRQMEAPFELAGREVFVDVCTGLVFSDGYSDAHSMLRDADAAMYNAKQQGPDRHQQFEADMYVGALVRLDLENDLRRALPNNELEVFYQPIVALESGRLAGFEALVRWNHPDRTISPSHFIPVAEETGAIEAIGEWMLARACQQLHLWQSCYPQAKLLHVGVNVSARQFRQPTLLEAIDRILEAYPVAEGSLKVELTESALMDNPSAGKTLLQALRSRQIQLCLDDFGTGYSSMSYLQQLPLSTLKIDRSFVQEIALEEGNPAILLAIVTLAHSLGLNAIAEGVELPQQRQALTQMQCEYGQGYLFSKPLNAADAEIVIQRSPIWLTNAAALPR